MVSGGGKHYWLWDRGWEESAASGKSAAELDGALSGAGDGRWRRKAFPDCGKRSEGVRTHTRGFTSAETLGKCCLPSLTL